VPVEVKQVEVVEDRLASRSALSATATQGSLESVEVGPSLLIQNHRLAVEHDGIDVDVL
jgi:hypothetical protein